MKLPKPENWTKRTTQRVIDRLNRLFDLYEKHSNVDGFGKELSTKANEYYLEGLALQDKVSPHEFRSLGYRKLF